MDSRAHHVEVPKFTFFIRIAQLLLAVILLGLLAYIADKFDGSGTNIATGSAGFGLFTTIVTILFLSYYLATTLAAPRFYSALAIAGVEAALLIFWLITWALLADLVATEDDIYGSSGGAGSGSSFGFARCPPSCIYDADCQCTNVKRSLVKRGVVDTVKGVSDAALAFSLIQWFLFIATAVFFALGFLKRRRSTGPTTTTTTTHTTPQAMEAQPQPAAPMH